MRSGSVFLAVIAAVAPGAARATDWYTGAPGGAAPPPTAFISSFAQPVEPVSAPVGSTSSTESYWSGGSSSSSSGSKSRFDAAVDIAVTADTKGSRFGTVIGTIAPFGGFDQSGARLRLGGVLGQYSYIGGGAVGRVSGTQADGSFMVGYEWVTRRASFAIYGGANYNDNKTDKADPNNASIGQGTGLKVAIDFSYRPSEFTMFSGVASFSTVHNAYYARLKGGYAFAPQIYVGPEAIFMGDDFFQQWRIGMHMTGAKFSMLQLGVSGGVLVDKVRGTGLYGILDARVGF